MSRTRNSIKAPAYGSIIKFPLNSNHKNISLLELESFCLQLRMFVNNEKLKCNERYFFPKQNFAFLLHALSFCTSVMNPMCIEVKLRSSKQKSSRTSEPNRATRHIILHVSFVTSVDPHDELDRKQEISISTKVDFPPMVGSCLFRQL